MVAVLAPGACAHLRRSAPTTASAATPTTAHLEVRGASVDRPADGHTTAVRMVIVNGTRVPDRLLSIRSDEAGSAMIHTIGHDALGRTTMTARTSLAIPAGATVYFAPGLRHLMLSDLRQPLEVGDHVHLELRFEHAGTVDIDAPVRPIPSN